ncbi:proline-rich receptor-like protein kinase PERK12 [Rhododendron vialii]|uniref:proline-rich receptor-like protein kinase PERK12 n=1 Tax=Rhododendron vialii TaxID=182163 RepID=UPI002660088D|nr:proline-rich receptor-like protein kinase PERK12 [Rhododendron vialii]
MIKWSDTLGETILDISVTVTPDPDYQLPPYTLVLFSEDELKRFTNNYALDHSLGIGQFGVVFSGHTGEQEIVVKMSFNGMLLKVWQEEIESLPAIGHHKNLIQLLGYSLSEGIIEGKLDSFDESLYLVYPRYARSLSDILKSGEYGLSEIIKIVKGVALGLAHMHSGGWIHCDLKPDNIVLDEHHEAVIIDFGNMVRIGRHHFGTFCYHDVYTASSASPLSDLHSLGVIMLQLIMKRMFPNNLRDEVAEDFNLRKHVHTDIGKDRKSKRVGAHLISLALDCSNGLLIKRPASVRHFIDKFEEVVARVLSTFLRPVHTEYLLQLQMGPLQVDYGFMIA